MAQRQQKKPLNKCRECVHVIPVTEHYSLSVKGEPTLGKCPYWEESPCVALSQASCAKFDKKNGI